MKDIWRPLLDVLDETLALYKQLLVLSEEKRKVLIEAQHIALEEITRREAPLVLEGSRLEERRAKVTAALAINYQLANQKPTLSELAAVAEPEVSEYLSAYSEDLGGTTLGEVPGVHASQLLELLAIARRPLGDGEDGQVRQDASPGSVDFGCEQCTRQFGLDKIFVAEHD